MRCRVKQIKPWPIFHFDFNTQYDMTSTFIRIQEHYESPFYKHREQYFSLEEYMDWYVKKHGMWDYFVKWDGFNVPDFSIKSFYGIFGFRMRPKEKWVFDKLSTFKNWPGLFSDKPYYIICTNNKDKETLHHELRHALFDINKEYAKKVTNTIKKYSLQKFKRQLKATGYSESHFIDEINAYACDGWMDCRITKKMKELSKKLDAIEKEFFDGEIQSALGS